MLFSHIFMVFESAVLQTYVVWCYHGNENVCCGPVYLVVLHGTTFSVDQIMYVLDSVEWKDEQWIRHLFTNPSYMLN
jgi:hypothetical protein